MCIQNRSIGAPYRRNAPAIVPITLVTVALTLLHGCGSGSLPAQSPERASALPVTPAPTRAVDHWAIIDGATVPVRLRLPYASEWRRQETATSLRLEHPGEAVKVVVRLWASGRLVTTERCLAELALLEPAVATLQRQFASAAPPNDATNDEAELLVSQRFEPGEDFRGATRAMLQATSDNASMTAAVLAVAAGVGRCLAVVAITEASGTNAEEQLAGRLAWMVEGATKSLSLRSISSRVAVKPQ